MKKFLLTICVVSSILGFSCKKNSNIVEPEVIGNCDTVTYLKHIQPIIAKSCLNGCHNGSQSPLLTSYSMVKSSVDNGSFKKSVLTNRSMPQGSSLSANQLGLILCWLNSGAKQN